MKRKLYIFVAFMLIALGCALYLEFSRRSMLAKLSPFAEFNLWKRMGIGKIIDGPSLFAYPSDISFHTAPQDPATTAFILWHVPGLETVRINLYDTPVPRELLTGANASGIKVLDLDSANIDAATLAEISGASQLEMLILTGSTLSSIPHLTLPKLKELALDQSKITSQGLQPVYEFTSLHTLNLSYTEITHIDPSHATALSQLRLLRLNETKLDHANIDKLRKTLPQTEIVY